MGGGGRGKIMAVRERSWTKMWDRVIIMFSFWFLGA